jgi:hypothetical protein
MRKAVLLCLLLTVAAGLARGNAAEGDLTKTEAVKTARKWAALVGASDVAGLDSLLNERYTHTHGSGLVETRKLFLEALRSGARDYVRCKVVDPRVNLLGKAAVVSGTLEIKVLSRGKTIEGTNRFMMVMVRTDKGIEVAAYQATPLQRKN